MKRSTRINLVILLMALAGLGLMLFPTISDRIYRWNTSREIAQYNEVAEAAQADYSALWAAAEDFNRRLAQGGAFSAGVTEEGRAEVEQLLNPLGIGMMGYIDIPKIDVHLPIYQGIEESALQAGAGYWIGTSLPTGGESTHCVLTAHNGLVRAKMFTDLDQLEMGDTFSLSILDRVLAYEVDQILVTSPMDLSPLEIVEGEDYVTLYTCTPRGVNTHRLLVRGHRVADTQEEAPQDSQGQEPDGGEGSLLGRVLAGAGALLALLLLAGALYTRRRQRPGTRKYQPKRLHSAGGGGARGQKTARPRPGRDSNRRKKGGRRVQPSQPPEGGEPS